MHRSVDRCCRHGHGSAYMSDDFHRELTFLVMESLPSFEGEPEGNGCPERFIRTPKENLLWVRCFATVEELAKALKEFKRTCDERWPIRRHGHRTPSQVRRDLVGGKSASARISLGSRPENLNAIQPASDAKHSAEAAG